MGNQKKKPFFASMLQELAPDITNVDSSQIRIPKDSFTALRLLYGTPNEISHLATTTFLGKIPDAWIKISVRTPLNARKVIRKSSTKDWILDTASDMKARVVKCASSRSPPTQNANLPIIDELSTETGSVKSRSGHISPDMNSDARSIDSKIFDEMLHRKLIRATSTIFPGTLACQSGLGDDTCNIGGLEMKPCERLELKKSGILREITEPSNPGGKSHQSSGNLIDEPAGNSSEQEANHRNVPSLHDALFPSLMKGKEITNECSEQKIISDVSYSLKQEVMFVHHMPEVPTTQELFKREYIIAERDHHHAIRKMRSMARHSRNIACQRTSKLKFRLSGNTLENRGAGEILRVDKMLVMIKKEYNVKSMSSCTEISDFVTTIQDHWKEYDVVLRATDGPLQPLSISLFEVSKKKNFFKTPEHTFLLSKQVTVEFFSHTDKTISVTHLEDDEMRLFIFNPKYVSKAYKWLYTIKEVLGEEYYSVVNVSLAGKSTKIKVNVPKRLLRESLSGSNLMILHKKKIGYTVEKDVFLEYAKSRIGSLLESIVDIRSDLHDWKKRNPNPEFCFTVHDKREWITTNAQSLVMQSQFLREHGTLELKESSNNCLTAKQSKGNVISRPYPIEGFLSRISDYSGASACMVKAIYKIQYFLSSDRLLFFSSFHRGMPPSPHNELLGNDIERQDLAKQLPEIYTVNPLATDENQHFFWLEGANFERFDDEAAGEFSRRLQQIVNAKAVVDLSIVFSIRAIPFHRIQSRHLCFQSYMWYSSASVMDDMSLMDSGFEIEFDNGSSLQLLAPSRRIRDEWVERLGNSVNYWRAGDFLTNSKKKKLLENTPIKHSESSEKDTFSENHDIYNNAGLAMSTCILRSGYLYQKPKKHANFSKVFVVLFHGYLSVFSVFIRSRTTGESRIAPYFERYMTIPISECYIYSGVCSKLDLVHSHTIKSPAEQDLPRLYPNACKSSEEEYMRCFSIWFGGKRALRHGAKQASKSFVKVPSAPKNPGTIRMTRRSGMTGKVFVFIASSRQERELWVSSILQEIDSFSDQ